MSTEHITRRNKTSPTVSEPSDSAIAVTNHARLRYLQRVDASCPNPNQQLRKMFRTGQTAECHPDRRAGDVLVVYRGSEASPTIITLLNDTTQRSDTRFRWRQLSTQVLPRLNHGLRRRRCVCRTSLPRH